MSEIVLGSLKKRFGAHEVVAGLDVTIPAGAAVALLGPSGCGKTTTLRMLAGLERPTSGSIALAGRVVDDAQTFVAPEHRDVGMVFQSYALWPHLTVLENVGYPLLRRGVPREPARQAARQMLTKVHLTAFADCAPGVLSGGQQQRVALARGLIHRPALLLLDEPLANLDTQLREEMRAEVATLAQQSGATVVSVTHDQAEAFVLSLIHI